MIKITKTESSPLKDMSGLTWYFIGPPKSGKTTNAGKWSSQGSKLTLLIDTDKGSDFMVEQDIIPVISLFPPTVNGTVVPADQRGYVHRQGSWKGKPMPVYSMQELMHELWEKRIPDVYETIVIDTIDTVYEWAEQRVKEKYSVEDIGEIGYGKGWGEAKDIVVELVESLQNFCKQNTMNLVIISHAKETTMTDGKVQLGPELPRGLSKKLTAMSDAIGYATFDKESGKPTLSFESYDERAIGSRIPQLHNNVYEFSYDAVIDNKKKESLPEEQLEINHSNNHINNQELINA